MKIVIEPENEDEKKQFPKNLEFNNVFEFAFTGRRYKQEVFKEDFSHLHVADNYKLRSMLFELIERLRDADTK
jgi:hypothetical protein